MLPTSIMTGAAALDDEPPADAAGIQGRSPWQLAWGRLRADRMAWFAGSLVLFVILLALSAPILSAVTGHSGTEPNVDYGTSDTGQPLPPGEGPLRLIVPGEKRPARAERQVLRLIIRRSS